MTAVFLVRHGAHDRLGRYLDGRRPGIHLSDEGRAQARQVGERLARASIGAVYSSPLARAWETAVLIGAALGCDVRLEPALEEVDFGTWSGMTFEALRPDEAWQRWNSARSIASTPAGDTMRAVQTRLLDFIDAARAGAPDDAFVCVSHADPIKSALAFYLGISLDDLQRFEIAPASVSRIELEPWGARVASMNETAPA